jgi:DNA replication protein DnaC
LAAVASGKSFGAPPSLVWLTEKKLVEEQVQRKGELYRKAEQADILVLDELGTAGGHVSQVGQFPIIAGILEERYAAGLSTIATSGLSRVAIAERYGAGTLRRLMHGAEIVDLFTGV